MGWLKISLWDRNEKPWVPGHVWKAWEHCRWGDSITFSNWPARRVMGHLPERMSFRVDDELRARMETGRIARFRVVEVKFQSDPPDMFFATVTDIGYEDGRP